MLDNLPGSMTATEVQRLQSEVWQLRQDKKDNRALIDDLADQLSDAHCRIADLQKITGDDE